MNNAFATGIALEQIRLDRLALLPPREGQAPLLSAPNAITLSGYAAGLAWAAGGNPVLAAYSLLADELDGVSARNLGLTSGVGDRLDWGVDVCMLAIVGVKAGLGWWALPLTLFAQVVMKERGVTPPFGSARALLTGYALL